MAIGVWRRVSGDALVPASTETVKANTINTIRKRSCRRLRSSLMPRSRIWLQRSRSPFIVTLQLQPGADPEHVVVQHQGPAA
jgi:hypothetical protein